MAAETFHLLQPRPYPNLVSLVIPMFNEDAVIAFLRPELEAFMGRIRTRTEIILVNDGSSDRTLSQLLEWAGQDTRIKVIHLSRNFGHQIAATAGLDHARGDAVILIDADLQDPLDAVHRMIERYCEGYDVVYGQRQQREGESKFKLFTAWAFYRIMRNLVYKRLPTDSGDFRLLSRQCLDGLKEMREVHRFLRGMVAWVGYAQIALPYQRAARVAGETKYPLHKMLALAWTAATSFSIVPLQFILVMGLVVGLLGIEEGIRALLAWVLGWYTVPGWTSLTVVTSLIGSMLLIGVGIVGQYVGKIYEQIKERPLYLISRTYNVENDQG